MWFYSDGQILKRKTRALLEGFTVDKSQATTGKSYAETLRASLDEEVELQYPSMIEGMPALPAVTMKRSQLISAYKGMVFTLNKVELSNIKILSVHIDGDHATVVVTFSAEVDDMPDRLISFKLELGYLKKPKNGWRVKRMVWKLEVNDE